MNVFAGKLLRKSAFRRAMLAWAVVSISPLLSMSRNCRARSSSGSPSISRKKRTPNRHHNYYSGVHDGQFLVQSRMLDNVAIGSVKNRALSKLALVANQDFFRWTTTPYRYCAVPFEIEVHTPAAGHCHHERTSARAAVVLGLRAPLR